MFCTICLNLQALFPTWEGEGVGMIACCNNDEDRKTPERVSGHLSNKFGLFAQSRPHTPFIMHVFMCFVYYW